MTTPIDVSFRPAALAIEVTVSHARANLPELLAEVGSGGVVYLTRYGKRLAALVPPEAAEELARQEDEYWSRRAQTALQADGESVPWDEVVAESEATER
jgi:prevent-host-death family protein